MQILCARLPNFCRLAAAWLQFLFKSYLKSTIRPHCFIVVILANKKDLIVDTRKLHHFAVRMLDIDVLLFHLCPISRYVKAKRLNFSNIELVSQHSKQDIVWEVPQQSLCLALGAITCLPLIVTLWGCEERMGDQRSTKVAPWCKHCSSCGWWKSTSRDEAMLISEEIKS